MKKFLKIAAWIVGVLLLLLVAAVIIVPLVVDPNDYRDEITNLVERQTGREMRIEGDLELSLFPWVGLEIGQVQLANAEGFGPEPFARINQADVRVKLLPLLRREVAIDTVVLDGLRLHLARNEQGVTNWDDLIQAPAEAPAEPEQPAPEDGRGLAALAVGGLRVSDSYLLWEDRQANQRIEIADLSLRSGAVNLDRLGDPVRLALEFNIDMAEPRVAGSFAFNGEAAADLEQEIYRIGGARLETDLQTPLVPGGRLDLELGLSASANLGDGTAQVSTLELSAMGVRVTGELEASRITAEPQGTATLQLSVTDAERLDQVVKALQLPLPLDGAALSDTTLQVAGQADLGAGTARLEQFAANTLGTRITLQATANRVMADPQASGNLSVSLADASRLLGALGMADTLRAEGLQGSQLALEFQTDLGAETATVPNLRLTAAGVELSGDARAQRILEAPIYSGNLASSEFVPRDVMEKLGIELPEMSDASTLTKAALRFQFEGGTDAVALEQLTAQVDDTTLSGRVAASNFAGALPALRYDLTVDQVNVDRYLPPPTEGEQQAPPPASGAAVGALKLPTELLRSLDVEGTLRVGQLQAMNLKSTDILTTLTAHDGRIQLHPARAELYDGRYQGNISLDVRGEQPQLGIDEQLANIHAGPLLQDFLGEPYVSGRADVAAKLTTAGSTIDALTKNLNGSAQFSFLDGAVKGINIGHLLREALARYEGRPVPPKEERETDFASLGGTLTVTNGIVRNDDLDAKSPLLRITGEGSANLVEMTLDYLVNTTLVSTLEGQGGQTAADLKGTTIPIRIRGPFSDPAINVEVAAVLEAKAREALEAEKRRLEQEAEQKRRELEEQAQERLEQEKENLRKQLEDRLKNALPF